MRGALLWPCLLLTASASLALEPTADFYLKAGDRIVFFGDSITDHRIYDTIVETFVVTRYPKLNVTFVHSGWGGETEAEVKAVPLTFACNATLSPTTLL